MRGKDNLEYYQMITPNGLEDVENKEPEQVPVISNNDGKVTIKSKKLYKYTGAVKRWDRIVIDHMEEYTRASTEAEARRNFTFRAKKRLGLVAGAGGIKLTGSIAIEE